MITAISALTRTAHSIGRAITRLIRWLPRRAKIKVRINVSVPPFLKLIVEYNADLRPAANGNNPSIRPRHSA